MPTTFPRTCSCGRDYSEAGWTLLPLCKAGTSDGRATYDWGAVYEFRNCHCGTTLVRVLDDGEQDEGTTMNTAPDTTPNPTTIRVTTTLTVTLDVDKEWIDFVTKFGDIFGHGYIGYWALGVERDIDRGWLLFEEGSDEALTDKEMERVKALWRAGKELPARWFKLDREACIKAWVEGVKKWGADWYENADADRYDFVIQMALLGEHRYG